MTDVRALLALARKNLPPLKNNVSKDEIVLVENNSTSLVDKFHKQCRNDLTHDDANSAANIKWLRIKEQMITDMENKRDEEWKRNLSELDEEEGLEENDIFEDEVDSGEVGEVDCIDNNDANESLEEDDNVIGEEAEEVGSCDEDEDSKLNEDDDEIDENDNLNNESDLDEDDDEETQTKYNEDYKQLLNDENSDDDDCFIKRKRQKIMQLSDDEAEEDTASKSNFENEQSDDYYLSNGYLSQKPDELFISQNLPLTPICTPGVSSTSSLPNNANDYSSQMLVDLCSGQFNDVIDTDSQRNQSELADDLYQDDNDDSDPESLSDLNVKKKRSLNEFIEDEAELSGSEGSSDEDEDQLDGDDDFFEDKAEDLPSQDELRNQVEKLFNKDMIDEDKRQLMILKERFFEDGDLYDGTGERKKKFKWVLSGEEANEFSTLISDSDESDDNMSDQEDGGHVIRLKREPIPTTTIESIADSESTSVHTTSIRTTTSRATSHFEACSFKKQTKKSQVSLSSFVIRDQRLKEILNKKPGTNDPSVRKKGQGSLSIFDVLNS